VANYRARISGPLLDRFEVQVEVPSLPLRDLSRIESGESTSDVAARVATARARSNEGPPPGVTPAGRRILHRAIRGLGLSARAHDAILRVARTIAHLEGVPSIEPRHVAEAVQYRIMDRRAGGEVAPV
jgi:magnesium chelatase family protein